jgi:nucleoside-diphosphate-sugar epimerase
MRVDGAQNTFDFTHVVDIVRGIRKIMDVLDASDSSPLPPIHLVSGQATTLWQLAELANQLGSGRSSILEGPSRTFDVPRFVGCGARARELLDWSPQIALAAGIQRLIRDFGNCNEDSAQETCRTPSSFNE